MKKQPAATPVSAGREVAAGQAAQGPALLEIRELCADYRTRFGEVIRAVDGVSFSLYPGEVLGIAGESGCGKSTLAQACLGLFQPPLHYRSGSIRLGSLQLENLPVGQLRTEVLGRRMTLIPQSALNALPPTTRVENLATHVIRAHQPDAAKKDIRARLLDRFNSIGLEERVLGAYPVELSGGMRQRVVLAISTLFNPEVVFADEPTSALDVTTQKSVIRLLLQMMERGFIGAMVFITHELSLLYHIAHRVGVMYAGELVETGPCDSVLTHPRHPYSRALMETMDRRRDSGSLPPSLPGAPPDLRHPPPGCRFAERCPEARPEICPRTPQAMIRLGDNLARCQFAR